MPDAAVLFSGGRDSTLAALLVAPFYDVILVTCHAGITDDWTHARDAARRVRNDATSGAGPDGFVPEFRRVDLDRSVIERAARRVREDGHPRVGIQQVHEHAVERVATLDVDAVADGTRRDDRTPRLDRSTARSVEDRHGVDHLSPLGGVGYGAVREMADRRLRLLRGPSESIGRADYEAELRALLRAEGASVPDLFPPHEQSRVEGLRSGE